MLLLTLAMDPFFSLSRYASVPLFYFSFSARAIFGDNSSYLAAARCDSAMEEPTRWGVNSIYL